MKNAYRFSTGKLEGRGPFGIVGIGGSIIL
jgi:hypothetical protein